MLLLVLATNGPVQAQDEAAAPPLDHEQHLVELDDGRIFGPLNLPLYLRLSRDRVGDTSLLLPSSEDNGAVYLNEGVNRVPFGSSSVEVYGDGTPPAISSRFLGAQVYQDGDRPVYGSGLTVEFQAEDGGSGVLNTFISINGAPFFPYQTPLTDFTRNREITVRYYGVDRVGNVSDIESTTFLVDVRPPETTVDVSGTRDLEVYASDVRISLSSQDAPAGVATIRYRFDDNAEADYRGPISLDGLADGPHTLRVFAIDRVGNREPEQSVEFYFDNSAPTLSHSFAGVHHERDGVTYVAYDTRVQLAESDNRSGTQRTEYSINGSDWLPYALPFSMPQNSGSYTVRYRGVDKVGNQAGIRTAKVYLDKTSPSSDHVFTAPTFRDGNRVILTPGTGMVISALDLEAGVSSTWVRIDDREPTAYTDTLVFAEEGDVTVRYWSEDPVGNREDTVEVLLRVDDSPQQAARLAEIGPQETRFVTGENGVPAGATSHPFYLRIAASPEDTATTYLLAFNSASGDSFPTTLPGEGEVSLAVRMPDSTAVYSLFGDGSAPTSSVRFTGANRHESEGQVFFGAGLQAELTANDGTGIGVESIYHSVNGAAYSTYSQPLELFFSERPYSLSYYSRDRVGNTESPHTEDFLIDLTPPASRYTLHGPYYGNTLSPQTSVELLATDNLSGVRRIQFTIDGGEPQTYSGMLGRTTFQNLTAGDHVIQYWAIDHVGNEESPREFRFQYDPTPPQTELAVAGDQARVGGTLYVSPRSRVTLQASDDQLEIVSREVRINDAAFVAYGGPVPLPATTGRYSLVGRTRDVVGNVTTTPALAVFMDSTPPRTEVSLDGPLFEVAGTTYISPATVLRFSSTDAHAGVKTVGGRINGGAYRAFDDGLTLAREGNTRVQYRAVDRVNNAEPMQRLEVVVDASPPRITFAFSDDPVRQEGEVAVYPAGVTMYIETDDAISDVERVLYRRDGSERLYRTPLTGFSSGDLVEIEVESSDRLGNVAIERVRFRVE